MNDLKEIIANNIIYLRKAQKLTQADLAEKLNYSDKAISKWERAESVPDIMILKQIADNFGVSVDYLLSKHDFENSSIEKVKKIKDENKLHITLLSVYPVWIVATLAFFLISIFTKVYYWQVYVISIPVSAIVLIVFNSLWGKRLVTFVIASVLVWGVLASIYVCLLEYNLWQLAILGVLAQIVIITWSRIKK